MAEGEQQGKLDTEGSAQVLNEVKGRLENMETGDLPVIQRIGADGTVRQVDPTGEMIRPDVDLDAMNRAAEAFAAEVAAETVADPAPEPQVAGTPAPVETPRRGLWARIKAWFGRS